ncbi:MAG: hypothetical protein BJ554DRAFT_3551, partial [Olpidium bornovanus]
EVEGVKFRAFSCAVGPGVEASVHSLVLLHPSEEKRPVPLALLFRNPPLCYAQAPGGFGSATCHPIPRPIDRPLPYSPRRRKGSNKAFRSRHRSTRSVGDTLATVAAGSSGHLVHYSHLPGLLARVDRFGRNDGVNRHLAVNDRFICAKGVSRHLAVIDLGISNHLATSMCEIPLASTRTPS